MVKRKVVLLSTSMLLVSLFVVGCGSGTKGTTLKEEANKEVATESVNNSKDNLSETELQELNNKKQEESEKLEEEKAKEVKVGIWIPNVEYISTGDENLEKLVRVEVVSVSEEEESDKYMRMLKTLNKSGDSPIQVVEFKSAKLNGDVLEVDMADATKLGISSTTTEFMILEQVKLTMFENFEEVKSIQFKVDGKIVDSFLGHMDISGLFSR